MKRKKKSNVFEKENIQLVNEIVDEKENEVE